MLGIILFIGVPVAVIVGFIINLIKFLRCPAENSDDRKSYKTAAIVFAVILGIIFLAVAALFILLISSIAYM